MVTIFKNLTTALVTLGDFAIFGETLTQGIVVSVVIMVCTFCLFSLNVEGSWICCCRSKRSCV